MKTIINGTEYIPAAKVMEWLAEAREIIAKYPRAGEKTLRIEHSFTRTGYKVSYIPVNELLERVAKYPHTSFANRPALMELLHRIADSIDFTVEYENSKTVEVIRLSDGEHMMETPELAQHLVEVYKVAKYA